MSFFSLMIAVIGMILCIGCTNVVPTISQLRSIIAPEEKGGFVEDKSSALCFRQTPTLSSAFGERILFGGGSGGAMGRCRENAVLALDGNSASLTNQTFSIYPYKVSYVQNSGTVSDGSVIVLGYFFNADGSSSYNALKAFSDGSVKALISDVNGYIQNAWLIGDSLYVFGDFTKINGQSKSGIAILNALTGAFSSETLPLSASDGCQEVILFGNLKVFTGYNCSYGDYQNNDAPLFNRTTLTLDESFPKFKWAYRGVQDNVTGDIFVQGDLADDDALGDKVYRLNSAKALVTWDPPFSGLPGQMVAFGGRLYISGSLQSKAGENFNIGYVDLATNSLKILSSDLGTFDWVNNLFVSEGKLIVVVSNSSGTSFYVGTPTGSGVTFNSLGIINFVGAPWIENGELYWLYNAGYDSISGNYNYSVNKTSLSSRNDQTVFSFKASYISDFKADSTYYYVAGGTTDLGVNGQRNNFSIIDRSTQNFAHASDVVGGGSVSQVFLSGDNILIAGSFTTVQSQSVNMMAVLSRTDLSLQPARMNLNGYTQKNPGYSGSIIPLGDTFMFSGMGLLKGTRNSAPLFAVNSTSNTVEWTQTEYPYSISSNRHSTVVNNGFLYYFNSSYELVKIAPDGSRTAQNLGLNSTVSSFFIKDHKIFMLGGFTTTLGQSNDGWAVVDLSTSQLVSIPSPTDVDRYNSIFIEINGELYLTNTNYYVNAKEFTIYRWYDGGWTPLSFSGLKAANLFYIHFYQNKVILFGLSVENQYLYQNLFLFYPLNRALSKAVSGGASNSWNIDLTQGALIAGNDPAISGTEYYYFDSVTDSLQTLKSATTYYQYNGAAYYNSVLYLEGSTYGQCLSKYESGTRTDIFSAGGSSTCNVLTTTSSGIFFDSGTAPTVDSQSVSSNVGFYDYLTNQLTLNILPAGNYQFLLATKDYLILRKDGDLIRLSKETFQFQSISSRGNCQYNLFEGNQIFAQYCWVGSMDMPNKVFDLDTLAVLDVPLNIQSYSYLRQFTMGTKKIFVGDIKTIQGKYRRSHLIIYDTVTGSIE